MQDSALVSDEIRARRNAIDAMVGGQPRAGEVSVTPVSGDGFVGFELDPTGAVPDRTILYFHGGGFRFGSAQAWIPFLTRIAAATKVRILALDYSLAPEHPFPVATEEGLAAYRRLVADGRSVILAGDSAGGNLAASVALAVSDRGLPAPAAVILFSPWLDLTLSAKSFHECAESDKAFSHPAAVDGSAAYAGDAERADPRLSPLFGEWSDQVPVFLEASSIEVLRDDARALASALMALGVPMWFREVPSQPHVWPLILPESVAATQTLTNVTAFLGAYVLNDANDQSTSREHDRASAARPR